MQTGGSQAASEGPPGSVGWRQVASRLPAGSRVRLQLTDGVRLTGIVMAADDAAIVVKPKTRIPEPERRIPYAAIEMLEQDTGGLSVGKAVAIGVGAGAAAFLAIVFITFALIDD
jgi:hypothetical protein